jgi:hypothetical protein
LACLVAVLLPLASPAQLVDTGEDPMRKLVLSLSAGTTRYAGTLGAPRHLQYVGNRWGRVASGRLMWHPGHRLAVGVESGWTSLYSYSIRGPGPSGSLDLGAVPILLMFSMPLGKRVDVFAGYGTYRLVSDLEYLGRVRTAFFSQGYAAALSYRQPILPTIGLALEAKWMNAFVTGHNVLALQWRFDWNLHAW